MMFSQIMNEMNDLCHYHKNYLRVLANYCIFDGLLQKRITL